MIKLPKKITKATRIAKGNCNCLQHVGVYPKKSSTDDTCTYVFVAALHLYLLEDKRLRCIRE